MATHVKKIIENYDPEAPLNEASTPPASWYSDPQFFELEQRTVFSDSWQVVDLSKQVREPGHYITCKVAGEPILVIRCSEGALRAFYHVCRHHAAAVQSLVDQSMLELQSKNPVPLDKVRNWSFAEQARRELGSSAIGR